MTTRQKQQQQQLKEKQKNPKTANKKINTKTYLETKSKKR